MLCVQTKSLFTGQLNTMNIPAAHEQLERWLEGENMCFAMPDLKHDHRIKPQGGRLPLSDRGIEA